MAEYCSAVHRLAGYANGRFSTQAELRRFFESQPDFPKDLPGGKIRQQKVSDILNRVIYAGYVEHEPWGITRRKGYHEALVSLEVFEKVQARKNETTVAPKRKDINEDFPLRGAVVCSCCERPMTACWSKSATGKRYPYFWCQTRDCSEYRKSIRGEKIDAGFEEVMRGMAPSRNLLDLAMAMLKNAWKQRIDQAVNARSSLKRQVSELEKQQDTLIERLVETSNPRILAAFEGKIAKLEEDKLRLNDKLAQNQQPKATRGEIFELLKGFLSNPWNLYEKSTLSTRKTILKTAFKAPLAYDRKTGFRTPQTSVIFEFFADFTSKCEMVRPRCTEFYFISCC